MSCMDFPWHSEVGATILKLTYGYTIDTTKRDPLVDLAERALEQFSLSIVPGAWLVDNLPIRESPKSPIDNT